MSALSTELWLARMAVLERMCGPSCEAVIDASWASPALTDIHHQGFAPVRMSDLGEHGEEAPAAPFVHC